MARGSNSFADLKAPPADAMPSDGKDAFQLFRILRKGLQVLAAELPRSRTDGLADERLRWGQRCEYRARANYGY